MLRIPKQRFPKIKAAATGSLALAVGFVGSVSLLNALNNDQEPQGQVLSSSDMRSVSQDEAQPQNATTQDSGDKNTSDNSSARADQPVDASQSWRHQSTSSTWTSTPSTASGGVQPAQNTNSQPTTGATEPTSTPSGESSDDTAILGVPIPPTPLDPLLP